MELDASSILSLIENLIVGICAFELKGDSITPCYVNSGMWRMLGYGEREKKLVMLNPKASIIPEDLPVFEQILRDIQKDDGSAEGEFKTVTTNGDLRWLHMRGNLYSSTAEKAVIVCVLLDVTERKRAEEELRLQAERLNLLCRVEEEIILDYNVRTDVMTTRQFKKEGLPDELLFQNFLSKMDVRCYHPDDVARVIGTYQKLLESPGNDTIELQVKWSDTKEYRWYQMTLTSIAGGPEGGYVTHIVGRLIDIHEKKQRELELTIRAEKDSLTGLYNRAALEEMITSELEAGCDIDCLHAVMIIDLDNFKPVNDLCGHSTGDSVICDIAGIIHQFFKGGDIAGRIGGDEFLVFVRNIGSVSNADIVAMRLTREIHKRVHASTEDIDVTSSVGIAIYPYHGCTYQELFDKADKALYDVKANGKNNYRIYDPVITRAYHATERSVQYHTEETHAMSMISGGDISECFMG